MAAAVGVVNRCNRFRVSESKRFGVGVANRSHRGFKSDVLGMSSSQFGLGVGVGVGKVDKLSGLPCTPWAAQTPTWYPLMTAITFTITFAGVFSKATGITAIA